MNDFIEQLKHQEKLHRKSGANGLADLFMNAAEGLEQQQAKIERLHNPWISVEDELPQTYLSYDFAGTDVEVSDIVATNIEPAVYKDGEWVSIDWDSSELCKPIKGVTYWMDIQKKEQDSE